MKKSVKSCSLCRQILNIRQNPYFVSELTTGYVILGTYQFYRGYTLFFCKKHVAELHELPLKFRQQFLKDMSQVAEAVFKAFKPKKLNYELLGNTEPHLHWHLFPRYNNDPMPKRPIWCVDRTITMNKSAKPSPHQLNTLKLVLQRSLKDVISKGKNKINL